MFRLMMGTLIPFWLRLLAVTATNSLVGDPRYVPATVESARSLESYPTVRVP